MTIRSILTLPLPLEPPDGRLSEPVAPSWFLIFRSIENCCPSSWASPVTCTLLAFGSAAWALARIGAGAGAAPPLSAGAGLPPPFSGEPEPEVPDDEPQPLTSAAATAAV